MNSVFQLVASLAGGNLDEKIRRFTTAANVTSSSHTVTKNPKITQANHTYERGYDVHNASLVKILRTLKGIHNRKKIYQTKS